MATRIIPHARDVVVPRHVVDNAAFALSGLERWIAARELMPLSPVLRAMLAQAARTRTDLEAVLRMAERLEPQGQPGDAATLALWITVEEQLAQALGVAVPADRRLALYYATERQAWARRPEGFAEWTHERAAAWAQELAHAALLPVGAPPLAPDFALGDELDAHLQRGGRR